MTYAPYFISTVVVVSMTILVLSPRLGIGNERTFGFFGVRPGRLPRRTRTTSGTSTSGHDVWQTTGYSAVIYLAALAGIDPALYEAAKIDGASRLQRIRHVDLPGIMPTAVIILVLGVGNIMAIGFEKAFLLQNPLNLIESEIIATYVYKTGLLNADFSLGATAVGLFNSVINLVLLLVRQHGRQADHRERTVVRNVISKEAVLVERSSRRRGRARSLTGVGAGSEPRGVGSRDQGGSHLSSWSPTCC